MKAGFELVLIVESSFHLRGRGEVLHVHIVAFATPQSQIEVGDRVVAVMPDGAERHTSIVGIEFALGRDEKSGESFERPALLFDPATCTELLPAGTKIYRVEEGR